MPFLTTKILTQLLVVTTLAVSPAHAYCYYDSFGYYQCNNDLTYTARVLIGLGILAFCLALIGGIVMRRRSITRARNVAYLQTQQPGQYPPQYPPPGYPAPVGPPQYQSYPPKNEYGQPQPGYPGGFSPTPQEPPRAYNPSQPAYPGYGAPPPFPSPPGASPTVNNDTRPNQHPAPYNV